MADRLMELLDSDSPATILDVGCGTGLLTSKLMSAYPEASMTAIDVAPGMIDQCLRDWRTDGGQVEFLVADAESLALGRRFDLIASNSCFQWVSDLRTTLRVCADHLATPGVLAFSAPASGTLHELRLSYAAAAEGREAGHRLPDPDDYVRAVVGSGLRVESSNEEILEFDYGKAEEAIAAVRGIGAARTVQGDSSGLTRAQAEKMVRYYSDNFTRPDGRVTCTYRVVYVRARG